MLSWLKKKLPHRNDILNSNHRLKKYQKHLIHPNLWHFNCHSVSFGVASGLFAAFIPLPIQTLMALLLALVLRGNLIVAVVMTWVTNPFTFFPIVYITYKVGSWVINDPHAQVVPFDSMNKVEIIARFGKAYLVGFPIMAFSAAIIGYLLVNLFWQLALLIQKYTKKK